MRGTKLYTFPNFSSAVLETWSYAFCCSGFSSERGVGGKRDSDIVIGRIDRVEEIE
jgi:hypothetical protein